MDAVDRLRSLFIPVGKKPQTAVSGVLRSREEIGNGGTALLYRLTYDDAWREVEKILLPKYQGLSDYEALQKSEYEICRELNHPFVIRILASRERQAVGGQKTQVNVFEWVPGAALMDLSEFVSWLSPAARKAWLVEFSRQLISALRYIHSKGIIHGDLSLENIRVQPNGFIKILDFGVARRVDDPTTCFRVGGREYFRAPETLDRGELSQATDYFAFGRILEALAGSLAKSDLWLSKAIRTLTEDRQLPVLPRDASRTDGLSPLPDFSKWELQSAPDRQTKLEGRATLQTFLSFIASSRGKASLLPLVFLGVATFFPLRAQLDFNTLPFATVEFESLPGKTFETPIRGLELAPGVHRLKIEIPAYGGQVVHRKVFVEAGTLTRIVERFETSP